jgi:tetratricopeptide (TPR) repeat protein
MATASVACVTKKKRNETSKFGKFYHNTTAFYNGYWNSKEILKESMKTLRLANVDDYNKILEVEDFISIDNPKMVKADMDKILEKVSTVAQLHEPSDWVDDCYVMMGKAQYLKQEYETANETLEYFQEDFNPANPYGRNYKSKKPKGKAAKKAKAIEKKEKEKERKEKAKEKEAVKTEKAKTLAEERKEKQKERERIKKEKEKERKEAAKNRKKGIKTTKPAQPKTETPTNISKPTVAPKTEVAVEEDLPKPVPPAKPAEDKTAYSEGMLWLAKVYIKRENWFAAQMLLERLSANAVSDDIKSELPATYANLYIKQLRYEEALPKLDEAIEMESNKNLKARYAFIAGQLSQLRNNNDAALSYFTTANKYATNPKMEFMSELAVAKNGIISGKKSKEAVIKDLKKLLDENKYAELKDQIYFTLAEIELSQNKEEEAIGYFKNSIANNIADQKLKAEAYYRIANLYYNKEKYLFASNYYDSTLTLILNTDPRHTQVKRYVDNLKDIASNLSIIGYQDTLLYFASLDDDIKKKKIYDYLERNKKSPVETSQPKDNPFANKFNTTGAVDFGNSSFFAYNRTSKERGKEEFNKAWGRRSLEDDWRRSNKSSSGTSDGESSQGKVSEDDAKQDKITKEEYENFLREIPSNPVKKQEANDKIMTAMFTLGKLFRDKIDNYVKSAQTLEGMHSRFGPTPYELDSYFYLYLDYTDLANSVKANEYKNYIIKKYPDSKYASILSDPDYFSKSKSQINKSEQYYKTIYALYESGDYKKALDGINQSSSVLGDDNKYEAKMALLKAMCMGNTEGKDAYVKSLNEVISTYPNTPEQLKAKEIMRFLGGDKSAFANVQDVDKIFQREEASIHYVTVITYALEEIQHVNFKVAISEYNKKNFKNERLQLGDATLNIQDNSQIILIRKFDNEAKAMEYYNRVLKDKEEFSGGVEYTYDILPISQANYRKMVSERTAVSYRTYFENVILPSIK